MLVSLLEIFRQAHGVGKGLVECHPSLFLLEVIATQYRGLFYDWHWWSPSGSTSLEVDFVLWRDDHCVAIEAKASRRFRSEPTRGLNVFADGYRGGSVPRRIVVFLGSQRLRTAEGIDVLPVRDFLDEIEGDRLFV